MKVKPAKGEPLGARIKGGVVEEPMKAQSQVVCCKAFEGRMDRSV